MSNMAYNTVMTGSFTSNGNVQLVNLPGIQNAGDLVKFEVWNESEFGLNSMDTRMLEAYWFRDMAAGSAFVRNRTSGATTEALTNMITTNGFTLIDQTATQLQAAITGTTITQAGPAVASATQSFNTGDVVLITKSTGMLQIAGMPFTVTKVNGSSFDLTNLDASGFGAAASAFQVQKLNYQAAYYPKRRFITNISAAASAIITMSVTHGFTVGQQVRIIVPSGWGMTQMNNLLGTITAINATDGSGFTNTITVNINSSAFTAFAFPTSAVAATGVGFPQVVPVGEAATTNAGGVNAANLLDDATVNQSTLQMQFGSSVVGVETNVLRWIATRSLVLS